MTEEEVTAWLNDWYDRWSGPGEPWTLEDLAIGLTDAFTITPKPGMRMPRLLDLFCCQGGAATGYAESGFEVVGVDIEPQPLYPFTFHQGDAIAVLRDLLLSDILGTPVKLAGRDYVLSDFDAIHASPPCQAYSTITPDKSKHERLIGVVREFLIESGLPYVIENVAGARRELIDPMMLCGSSFGLRVRRHRFFESNVHLASLPCAHGQQGAPVGVYGSHGDREERLRPNGGKRGRKARDADDARDAMGMPWASWRGCAEAIPPAYSEHIGRQLLEVIGHAQLHENTDGEAA